jgi:vitamin B12 transporter
MKKLFFVLAMVLLLTSFNMADETKKAKEKNKDVLRYNIIVTATRTNQYYGELSSSTTVITAEDLKKSGKEMVVEALAEVPGLDVVQNGGVGKNASVFIRGANSEHTMVMIDGVEINDPMLWLRCNGRSHQHNYYKRHR